MKNSVPEQGRWCVLRLAVLALLKSSGRRSLKDITVEGFVSGIITDEAFGTTRLRVFRLLSGFVKKGAVKKCRSSRTLCREMGFDPRSSVYEPGPYIDAQIQIEELRLENEILRLKREQLFCKRLLKNKGNSDEKQ
jgi:hypothetical protein